MRRILRVSNRGIPRTGLLKRWVKDGSGNLVATLGLSVADFYEVDERYRSIFFTISGDTVTLKADGDAYTAALASDDLNSDTMIGSLTNQIVALYKKHTSPNVLQRAMRFIEEPILPWTEMYPDLLTLSGGIDWDSKNAEEYITCRTQQQISVIRAAVIADVWRSSSFPTKLPDVITPNYDPDPYIVVNDLINLLRVDRLEITSAAGFTSIVYHLVPTVSANRVAIYHFGHPGTWIANNAQQLVALLLAKGFDVYCIRLPGCEENTGPVAGTEVVFHNNMQVLETPTYNPMQEFFEPIAATVNYIETKGYAQLIMCGHSGGGWATDTYAGIDPRIDKSYSFGGSFPYFGENFRPEDGDYEQGSTGGFPLSMYQNIASFLDFYILAAAAGRTHKQVLVFEDNCCFYGSRFHIYKQAVKYWSYILGGEFDVVSDESVALHQISPWAQSWMANELKNRLEISAFDLTAYRNQRAFATYTLSLPFKPIDDVVITISASNGFVLSRSSITFRPSEWEGQYTIGVEIPAGSTVDAEISHHTISNDALYNEVYTRPIRVRNAIYTGDSPGIQPMLICATYNWAILTYNDIVLTIT